MKFNTIIIIALVSRLSVALSCTKPTVKPTFDSKKLATLIIPAVNGTLNVLMHVVTLTHSLVLLTPKVGKLG